MKLAILYRESTIEVQLFTGATPGHYWTYAFSPVESRTWTGPYRSKEAAERNAQTRIETTITTSEFKRKAAR